MLKLSTHVDMLTEAFDSPYPVRIQKKGKSDDPFYKAEFKAADSSKVVVLIDSREHIDDYDELQWRLSFVRDGKTVKTGQGDSLRIFATVLKLTQDFIKKENPKYIEFSSSKLRDPGESRDKLYDRMVRKYAGSKYKIDATKSGDDTTWRLTRK